MMKRSIADLKENRDLKEILQDTLHINYLSSTNEFNQFSSILLILSELLMEMIVFSK